METQACRPNDVDETRVVKKLLRYCEAILDIFEANHQIGDGGKQVLLPTVDPSDVSRQHVEGMAIKYFTQWARISVVMELW